MKNQTGELIKSYYAAFNAGDMEKFLSLLSNDVIHDINQDNREIGRDAFAKFMARMQENYQEQVHDLVIFVSENNDKRAAAEFEIRGKYLKTAPGLPEARGQTYILPVGAFFEIKDAKISRVTNYYNLQNWLTQVK